MQDLVRKVLADAWTLAYLLALAVAIKVVFMPLMWLANGLPGGD